MNSSTSKPSFTHNIARLATSALLLAGCDSAANQCGPAEKASALSQVSHDVAQSAKTVLYPIQGIIKNPAARHVSGNFQLEVNGSMTNLGHLNVLQSGNTVVECHTYGPFDNTVECQAGNVDDTGINPITLTDYVQVTASPTQISVEEPKYVLHGFPFMFHNDKGLCEANNGKHSGAILATCDADPLKERAACASEFDQIQLLLHEVQSSFAARIAP